MPESLTLDRTSPSGQFIQLNNIVSGINYEWDFEEYRLNFLTDLMNFEILSNFANRLVNSQKQLEPDIIKIVKENFFSLITEK